MKKFLLFLSFFLSAVLWARAGNEKEIKLNFNAADFTLTQENGAYSITSEKFPTIFDTDTLAPALPYFIVNVLIAPTQECVGLTVTSDEELLQGGIHVTPNKLPVPTNALETYVPNQIIEYAQGIYPSEEARCVTSCVLGNYKYVSLLVCPLRYDARNHALYMKRNMAIKLSLGTANKAAQVAAYPQSESYQAKKRREIGNLVYNPEDIDQLYPIALQSTLTDIYPTKYLIITNEALKPAFQRLANWKTTKGVRSKVLTIEDINKKYNDSIVPMRIKRAIMEYKGQVEYVLLGGDVEIVPSLMCKLDPYFKSPTVDTPTDLYYASLSDLDWDKNKNGFFGEDDDRPNTTSDLAVSRLSVCNLDEASSIVDKLIVYEKSPNPQQISDSILMCANVIATYSAGISDAQKCSEEIYKESIAPYWKGTRLRLYDTFTDFEGGADYDFIPPHLQEQLSKGYSIVDVLAHGWSNLWGHLEFHGREPNDSDSYTVGLAKVLTNPKYTTIVTGSCCVNWFDLKQDTLCLSETFMRNENSNVLAFVGYSREGFRDESTRFMKPFYEGLFKLGLSTAESVSYTKNQNASRFYNYYCRWLLLTLNMLGDPEAHLYLSKPKTFKDVQVHYANHQVSVTLDQDSCHVCLSKIDGNGELQFYRFQGLQGNTFTFEQIPDEFTLCVTKDGFIPYCVNVIKKDNNTGNGDVYIQNTSFSGNTAVIGKNIFVGKDVNRGATPGSVSIQNGKTTFQAEQTVTIKNGFQVEKGASLKVNTNSK